MAELEATREEYELLVAAISGMSTQLPILGKIWMVHWSVFAEG